MEVSILKKIIAQKEEEVNLLRQVAFKEVRQPPRGFVATLNSAPYPAIIAEIKARSPSKGIIRENFNALEIASSYYQHGCRTFSVLTDKQFFGGDLNYLTEIREHCSDARLLRKDFIIDSLQLEESVVAGADAVLLIINALTLPNLTSLLKEALALGLDILLEGHTAQDFLKITSILESTIDHYDVGKRILMGINNRDLNTFQVDLVNTQNVIRSLQADPSWNKLIVQHNLKFISESGINSPKDMLSLSDFGAAGFLIGETFMKSPDPGKLYLDFCNYEITKK
jgi:indole-3-glycerol phosphate synthase